MNREVALNTALAQIERQFGQISPDRIRPPRPQPMCRVAGHGPIIERSDAMGDSYCPDCRVAHLRRYEQPGQGRRLIREAARLRGGTCEFVIRFRDGDMRCHDRFEDGNLQWHHMDPTTKIASISTLAGGRLAILQAELDKCRLLCRQHHKSIHRYPASCREEHLV